MVSARRAGLRHISSFLLHYLLALLIDFGHEVILANFVLFVDDPGHLLLLVEHAAVHDEFLLLAEDLLGRIFSSNLLCLRDQLGMKYKFGLLLAFEFLVELPPFPLLFLLLLPALLIEPLAHIELAALVVLRRTHLLLLPPEDLQLLFYLSGDSSLLEVLLVEAEVHGLVRLGRLRPPLKGKSPRFVVDQRHRLDVREFVTLLNC